jgi:hypothetical protein
MNEKILPVKYPRITTYPPYADALAILCANDEAYKWVYSNYIQISVVDIINRGKEYEQPYTPCFFGDFDNRRLANTIADCIFLNRENCPFLNIFEIPNILINSLGASYVSTLKHLIDSSMYIYGYVNVAKIDDYSYLQAEAAAHEVLIYGYNNDEGKFYYADMLSNEIRKYKFSTCTYDDIESAFQTVDQLFIPMVKSFAAIQYVKNAPFKFDYNYVKESIYEYIHPDDEKCRRFNDYASSFLASTPDGPLYWVPKIYMGVNVYNYFSDYIHYEFNNGNNKRLDPRMFHAMYDHKELMVDRLQYLLDNEYLDASKTSLIETYKQVRKNALIIRNVILKFNIKPASVTVSNIHTLLEKTKQHEIELLCNIFDFD